jgi:cytidine deaminase
MRISKRLQQKLIKAAIEGMHNAFTGTNKPEDMRFGAAVLTKQGNIYLSGQYYSDTYSLTLHAEQAALAHAAAHGEYEIAAIAVTGNEPIGSDQSIYPCHMCKQLLWESYLRSEINTEIILLDGNGKILERLKLLDIINYPWPKDKQV